MMEKTEYILLSKSVYNGLLPNNVKKISARNTVE